MFPYVCMQTGSETGLIGGDKQDEGNEDKKPAQDGFVSPRPRKELWKAGCSATGSSIISSALSWSEVYFRRKTWPAQFGALSNFTRVQSAFTQLPMIKNHARLSGRHLTTAFPGARHSIIIINMRDRTSRSFSRSWARGIDLLLGSRGVPRSGIHRQPAVT